MFFLGLQCIEINQLFPDAEQMLVSSVHFPYLEVDSFVLAVDDVAQGAGEYERYNGLRFVLAVAECRIG